MTRAEATELVLDLISARLDWQIHNTPEHREAYDRLRDRVIDALAPDAGRHVDAEIERLLAAKRRALAIADERAKELAALRIENERLKAQARFARQGNDNSPVAHKPAVLFE
jgi:hypothetical protein